MWLCYNRIWNALGGVVFSKGIIWWGAPSPGFSRFCRFFHNQTFLDKKMLIKECVFPPSRSREKISSVRKNILSQTTGVNSNEHIRARSPYLPRLRSRGGPTRPRPSKLRGPTSGCPACPLRPRAPLPASRLLISLITMLIPLQFSKGHCSSLFKNRIKHSHGREEREKKQRM